jgi:PAP2 superfamily
MLILLVLVIESLWLLGFWKTLVTFVDLWALILYIIHVSNRRKSFIRGSLRILVPALYFSAGFVLISSYNVLIGSCRYFASYDQLFNSIDKILMFGWSVPELSRILAEKGSPTIFMLLEKSYFFMFPQIGAAIILLAIQSEGRQALRFVGTIALAYQFATLIYFCVPSLGPFYLSNPVSAGLPRALVTTQIQADLVHKLESLWQTGSKGSIGLDFYIAFPCMHIAQPLIVLWFLRSMKRIVWILGAYDFVMLFSIVFLQWHYVVDLAGGAIVSFIAIMIHQYQCKGTPLSLAVTPEPGAQETVTDELWIG